MPVVEEFVEVAASPEAVSDVLLDIEAAPLWTSGLERMELVDGVPGQAGCRGIAHYVEGGRRYEVEDRLVEAEPGHHFKSLIRGGGLRATVETRLELVEAGTRVTIRWSGKGTNPVTWLMLPLLGRRIAERCRADLEALGRLVESRAGRG
ncbi:MAG: SRPBCC family protein [Acidimicrobiia bacterium]